MKKFKKFIIGIFTIIFVVVIGFNIYASDYYRTDEYAREKLNDKNVVSISDSEILIKSKEETDKAIIFYPGAKVEFTSYLPILEKITEKTKVNIFLVKMPLNFAIFNKNKAQKIIEENSNIKKWYMAGHSLGGAMASSFSSEHSDEISGLILLGAYVYGNYPLENSLTIYGSLDNKVKDKIKYKENVVEIEGANHAQFGNYGEQSGDSVAKISSEEQQDKAVDAIEKFIN